MAQRRYETARRRTGRHLQHATSTAMWQSPQALANDGQPYAARLPLQMADKEAPGTQVSGARGHALGSARADSYPPRFLGGPSFAPMT
jgi:hypothetical protein